MHKIAVFLLLLLSFANVQGDNKKVNIYTDLLVLDKDSLFIEKTKLTDLLTQDQIDSLGNPYEVWDEVGEYNEYVVKRKSIRLFFRSSKGSHYLLTSVDLDANERQNIWLGDSLSLNNIGVSKIKSLEYFVDADQQNDSILRYRIPGVWFDYLKDDETFRLKKARIIPSHYNYYIRIRKLKGKIVNPQGEPINNAMMLAYGGNDTLRKYTYSDRFGDFSLYHDSLLSADFVAMNYEPCSIVLPDRINAKKKIILTPKIYDCPTLRVGKGRVIKFESKRYLKQFPTVRDKSKVRITREFGIDEYCPTDMFYRLPIEEDNFREFYSDLLKQFISDKRVRKCAAEIFFTIDSECNMQLQDIDCDDRINTELLAREFVRASNNMKQELRRTIHETHWRLRIVFE